MPVLSRIAIYPLKSFDPILVETATVLGSGALQHDRQFRLVDAAGKTMNAKRTAHVHQIQVNLDPVRRTIRMQNRPDGKAFDWSIDADRSDIEMWFSDTFQVNLTLQEDTTHGFPDDSEAPGPTIVSRESLQKVADWFPGMTLEQVRHRFRANLEISGDDPFWEDQLYGSEPGVARAFRIGDVLFAGTNPCQRCVVPSRDPWTGDVWPEFAKRFSVLRDEQLPKWASRARFDHYYRLSVNTRLIQPGSCQIRVGDPVNLVSV
jgi:uncharacterized protein YcbX